MKFITGQRVPLNEGQFVDAKTARLYDEHARRFMGSIYRRLATKAAHLGSIRRVLDLGTGSGRLAIAVAKARPDWQITGTDISEEMLKLARQNAARNGLAERIDFQQSPAESLPFKAGYFDLVVSNASLHLWTDPVKIFKEIERVLAPGGYCLMRDNLRLGGLSPLFSLIGRTMGMNKGQRQLWLKAIRSSYTVGEATILLKESPLKNARAGITGLFELEIEWRKATP